MTTQPVEKIPHPVGDSVPRVDAHEKVTGAAIFADDIQFGPGMLYARIVRSPHPHALIKSINVEKAQKLPGVKAVVTGEEFPGLTGLYLSDRYIFARDRVRYVGDPVAGVAAISEEIAEQAVELIEVEYEVLQPVLDPEFGASPEAPLLHPDLGTYEVPNFIFPQPGTNVSNHFKIRKGDVDSAWSQCAAIVERKYRIPHVQHVPIEPHVAVAKVDEKGKITLWGSSQSPFAQRNLIAKALHVSQSDVQVIAPYVGGGFGCKAGLSMEALTVCIASKVPGRPVKLRLTREEEFFTAFVRQGVVAHFKMGCDKNGQLIAAENKYYWDAGAYTEYGVNITRASGYSGSGPYLVPNLKIDSRCVYTNHPVGGPMRGFGMPEMHSGLEQCIDELALAIGMDPVEFRKINCVKDGDIILTGMKMHPIGLSQCIEKAAEAIEWGKKRAPSAPNKKRGKGIAIMWKAPAMPPNAGSSAWVELAEDGYVTVGIGGQEIGQGTFTVMAQMAAGALGVPYEWVRIAAPVDTKYSPYEWQTVASRLTWSMGNAVKAAALDAKKQVLEMVAQAWGEDIEDLDIVDGNVISYKSEETLPLKNIVIYGMAKPNDQGLDRRPDRGTRQLHADLRHRPRSRNGARPARGSPLHDGRASRRGGSGPGHGQGGGHQGRGRVRHGQGDQSRPGEGADGRRLRAGHEHGAVRGDPVEGRGDAESQFRRLPHRHQRRRAARSGGHHRGGAAGRRAVGGARHRRARAGADDPGDRECDL